MAETTTSPTRQPYFSWYNPDFRAMIYQVVTLSAVVMMGWFIFSNTQANLAKRGITSGFSFLDNEAGFGMSEILPVPQLEGGFPIFLLSIFLGIGLTWGLKRYLKTQGKTIGDDYRFGLVTVFFLFCIPGLTYFFTHHLFITANYTEESSYGIALATGVFNTIKVSLIGCLLATLIGFLIGIARLSSNWLISTLAASYIETVRNIPLLLQIFFWYFAVIQTMPGVQESIVLWENVFVNNRGIYVPNPTVTDAFTPFLVAVFLASVGVYFWNRWVRIVRDRTGQQLKALAPSIALLVILPGLVWLVAGSPYTWVFPVLEGFNYEGGLVFSPEYASLLIALSMYHGSFIAEIVRSGIQAVSKGQKEAAGALGLRAGLVLRLVVIPQSMRVIIPPLTSQFLNLTKNSSLAVAIAYPELVSVGGTVLNQSGQAIEIIGITMAIYLTFSLLISLFMNWYNEKMKLVER